jgi:transcriptional regulator with XRE-family HTH domain
MIGRDEYPAKNRRMNMSRLEDPASRIHAVDRHVGARIRECRVMLGLSQQQLASAIGITYQQALKYERGVNRITAGRLYEIARLLGVPIGWFFEGMADTPADEASGPQRMCLELARNFCSIKNERMRDAVAQMARSLATD